MYADTTYSITLPKIIRFIEIKRKNVRKIDYTRKSETHKELDPFELCCEFLKDLDEIEEDILKDVINTVQEVT